MPPAQQLRIVDLAGHRDQIDVVAELLRAGFEGQSPAWPDHASALEEVLTSLENGKISRVALGADGQPVGWVAAAPMYAGNVWELHPLVVSTGNRSKGIGRALVLDIEQQVMLHGGAVLLVGTDDEDGRTNLFGLDLFPDVLRHLLRLANLRGHPFGFYQRMGFSIVGVVPDANGFGRPDILMAKRVAT